MGVCVTDGPIDGPLPRHPLPDPPSSRKRMKSTGTSFAKSFTTYSILLATSILALALAHNHHYPLEARQARSQIYDFVHGEYVHGYNMREWWENYKRKKIQESASEEYLQSLGQLPDQSGLPESASSDGINLAGRGGSAEPQNVTVYTLGECANLMVNKNKTTFADRLDCPEAHFKVSRELWFIFLTLILGWLLRLLSINSTWFRMPFTVGLMALGIILAIAVNLNTCLLGCSGIQYLIMFAHPKNLNGHKILNIFLPVLLFESAFDIDQHLFIRGLREPLENMIEA